MKKDYKNMKGQLEIMKTLGIKPNFSELERTYGINRHTIKKYYEGYEGNSHIRAVATSSRRTQSLYFFTSPLIKHIVLGSQSLFISDPISICEIER